MKGQVVNIDWIVGLFLFITALIIGIFLVVDSDAGLISDSSDTRSKAEKVMDDLETDTFIEARKVPLYVKGPVDTGRIPIDRSYVFPSDAHPESAIIDGVGSMIDEGNDEVIAVVETGNRTYEMAYFFKDTSNASYSNQLNTGNWINGSEVKLKPGGNGLESLHINNNEILNSSADLNSNNDTIFEKELYAETLDGNLKLYSNSNELILENPGTVSFQLRNFTTLWWEADNSTTNLQGTGTFKDSSTKALTLATFEGNDYGITFLGDIDATVSKPDKTTVDVEITESDRLRIYLQNSSYEKGWKRSRFYNDGEIYFGTENKIEGRSLDDIDSIDKLSPTIFEGSYELENWGYNISFGPSQSDSRIEKGNRIPFDNVIVLNREDASVDRYADYSKLKKRVSIWR